jgi:hypothetical protein
VHTVNGAATGEDEGNGSLRNRHNRFNQKGHHA